MKANYGNKKVSIKEISAVQSQETRRQVFNVLSLPE